MDPALCVGICTSALKPFEHAMLHKVGATGDSLSGHSSASPMQERTQGAAPSAHVPAQAQQRLGMMVVHVAEQGRSVADMPTTSFQHPVQLFTTVQSRPVTRTGPGSASLLTCVNT